MRWYRVFIRPLSIGQGVFFIANQETCIRCGGEMVYLGQEQIQLGKFGFFTGAWSNLAAGALRVNLFCCSKCRKLEFYAADELEASDLPQAKCPYCGRMHDFDDPTCPFCGRKLI